MLAVIGILMIFFAVVRHKWRDAAAKKEEILRLVAMASREEAEIANRDKGYGFPASPLPQPTQVQERFYCVICLSPTTTRCSQCKAVRYCSGKCQIIHWRKGHKYECQLATIYRGSMGNECVVPAVPCDQGEMYISDEAKRLLPDYGVLNFKSDSVPSCSFPPDQSEVSLNSATSEFHDSDSSLGRAQTSFGESDSHFFQTTSDSKNVEIEKTPISNNDDSLQLMNTKSKRTDGTMLDELVPGNSGMRNLSTYSSMRKFVSSETQINQAPADTGDVMKSFYLRGSDKRQLPNVELKKSNSLKSVNIASSIQEWKNEAYMCTDREARSTLYKSSGNDQTNIQKPDNLQSFVSEAEPKSISKGLKTSVRKIVESFRTSKHSNSYLFDIGKDSIDIYSKQVVFLPKIFPQLYSFIGVEIHPFGLTNCGNSCYANSVLQCLLFTRPLASYFLQGLHSNACRKKDWCLICEFENLARKGQGTNYPLSAVRILSQVKRIGSHLCLGQQEDAHDFLRNVVEKMQYACLEESGFSGSLAEDSTLVGLTFGGYLQSKVKCMKCSGRSEQCDRVMDLAVEINGNIHSLEDALTQFTSYETLEGDDKYKCSRCKSYVKAKKRLTLAEAPNILTIVLKRFKSGNSEKLNKFVRFPEDLDLTPYMSRSGDGYPIYHLYAVVVHLNMMNVSYSGHYISYVKDFKGAWFKVDDSKVIHVDVKTVLSVEAYILFYARHAVSIRPSVMNNSMHSHYRSKMSMEAVSARTKNNISKPKPTTHYPKLLHEFGNQPYWTPSDDFFGNLNGEDEKRIGSSRRSPVPDSLSDNSSIFSASDSGSYTTDSTKDSDISGYIFGSSGYHP